MGLLSDLRVIWHLTMSPVRGQTHRERLDSFYQGQADAYDDFRKRLLQGREAMMEALPLQPGGVWADFGGGTGANAEFLGERVGQVAHGYIVDLCQPLLDVAAQRFQGHGWPNMETLAADATTAELPHAPDAITFSYALTMIPDWYTAIDHAYELLKPGGHIGIVDFYVARTYPTEGFANHGWWTRNFWPFWFANDNVFLSRDHLPYLLRRFEAVQVEEHRARVPYLPLGRVPYYIFIGKKPE